NAPHLVQPMRVVLPHPRGLRPAWVLRRGLILYDPVGGRKPLPATPARATRRDAAGKALPAGYRPASEHSDCAVEGARLVVLNARDATDKGAQIHSRTRVVTARRRDGLWHVEIEDVRSGARHVVRAKLLVNAAGPWIDHILVETIGLSDRHNVRLVQGS